MKQFYPQVEVILHPIVTKNYGATDITEWFGENCVITTAKGILEPSGTFSITFLDINADMAKEGLKDDSSLYSAVRPMDGIEIRACHDGSKETRLLMRGFVSRISREETIGEDGTPVRRITISGEDVGKIWLTQYLHFLPTAEDATARLAGLGFAGRYFGDVNHSISGVEFVKRMGDILAKNVANITMQTEMGFAISTDATGSGEVALPLLQGTNDISIYQFMASMLDAGAFYELWIDDPGDGPAIIRWRELWSGPDNGVTITTDDIASIQVWRDDSRVSNWYFAYPRGGILQTQLDYMAMAQRAGDICDGRKDQWSQEKHFGWRKMEVEFALRPENYPSSNDATTAAQYRASVPSDMEWIKQRTRQLRDLNKDNANLENCTVVLCGNEDLRPGQWVTVQKSEMAYKYYAVRVEHQIHLFNSFKTTLHGQRGQVLSGSGTYSAELDLKGVY